MAHKMRVVDNALSLIEIPRSTRREGLALSPAIVSRATNRVVAVQRASKLRRVAVRIRHTSNARYLPSSPSLYVLKQSQAIKNQDKRRYGPFVEEGQLT